MKHEPTSTFGEDTPPGPAITIMQAIGQAKEAISSMTGQPIDSVVHCARGDNLNWRVSLDVVESFARMGDNDLLATYEVQIGHSGEMQTFSRLRRYHREDRDS